VSTGLIDMHTAHAQQAASANSTSWQHFLQLSSQPAQQLQTINTKPVIAAASCQAGRQAGRQVIKEPQPCARQAFSACLCFDSSKGIIFSTHNPQL
jgi:hypothetical protein